MEIKKEDLMKMFAAQGAVNAKNTEKEKPAMPDYLTDFTVYMWATLNTMSPLWRLNDHRAAPSKELVLASFARCYGSALSAILCVPAEIKKNDGTADHPFDTTVDNFINLVKTYYTDVTSPDKDGNKASIRDVVQLIGTACELQDNQHLSFLSEFVLLNVIIQMAYPTLTFDEIVKYHASYLAMLNN